MLRKLFTSSKYFSHSANVVTPQAPVVPVQLSKKQIAMEADHKYVCPYYHSPDIVIEKGEGIYLYDTEGTRYMDMLAGFGVVNFGHCNPRIAKAMYEQSLKLTLCSRSLKDVYLGKTAELICNMTGYDKFLA